jgi:pyruvate,water dikinase
VDAAVCPGPPRSSPTAAGTLAAHASLVARQYGIPAVVATGDATARVADRQMVTVDAGAGTVELHC